VSLGCRIRNKSPAVIAVQCNDRNPCTTDTCNVREEADLFIFPKQLRKKVLNGQCVYTPGAVTCPTSDACKVYTCNSTTGNCDLNDIAATCTGANACQVERQKKVVLFFLKEIISQENFCDSALGCRIRSKSPAVIAVQCNDRNPCTTDTCNVREETDLFILLNGKKKDQNGQCVYTPGAVTCPTSDQCNTFTCNSTTGLCDRVSPVCRDTNPCTRDLCNPAVGCEFPLETDQAVINGICNPSACQVEKKKKRGEVFFFFFFKKKIFLFLDCPMYCQRLQCLCDCSDPHSVLSLYFEPLHLV
jgi:hypothetical protein